MPYWFGIIACSYKIGFLYISPIYDKAPLNQNTLFIIFFTYVKKKMGHVLLKVFLLFLIVVQMFFYHNECKAFQLMFTSYIMVMSLFFKLQIQLLSKNSVAL